MKLLIVAVTAAIVGISSAAFADPEQSYKGGKAMRDSITGTKSKVDDRDGEQRAKDYATQKGCQAGGGKNCGGSSSRKSSGTGGVR